MEDLHQYRSLNYEQLKGDKKGLSSLLICYNGFVPNRRV